MILQPIRAITLMKPKLILTGRRRPEENAGGSTADRESTEPTMDRTDRTAVCSSITVLAIVFAGFTTVRAQDQLPSWNDTAPKKAIVAFVERVTKEGSPDFAPPNERIATFDSDGARFGMSR
jgi:hypothetical protein